MRKKLKTYFPGEFNPPTKYDLDVAKWLSRKTLDVLELIIVIGKDKDGELSQDDKEAIWDLYLGDNVSAPIKVVKSQNLSPLSYIYKEQENDPEEAFAIALDEETSNDERFQSHFDMFTNYEVIITPTYQKQDLVPLAKEGDFKKFSASLPSALPKEDKQKIFNLVKGPTQDPVDEIFTKKYWKTQINSLLEKAGIKDVTDLSFKRDGYYASINKAGKGWSCVVYKGDSDKGEYKVGVKGPIFDQQKAIDTMNDYIDILIKKGL